MEMKLAFSLNFQTKYVCFCLPKKLNKVQATQIRNIMQSSRTFIRISGLIPEVKKYAMINDYENIIAYSEESKQEGM